MTNETAIGREAETISLTRSGAAPPQDIAPAEPLISLAPADPAAIKRLVDELGLHHLAAQTLVSRGVTEPVAVAEWLRVDAPHPPELLPGALDAARAIHEHVRAGTRIGVHGDYDVDGVCSTAILVRALAGIGAEVTWHVPSRFDEGYGLSKRSLDRLAEDGVGLIVAVDCGIGSVAEVEYAHSLGVDVVICDHHTIGEQLPAAPIVHPGLADYPDPYLCAAAATHKLASLLVGLASGDAAELNEDLALVALATVCDVVPLTGENRSLVSLGVERLRTTQRPGLRELMRVARVDQLKIAAGSLGFTLGPRINAAGRLHSAEPAVELLLTSSEQRAAELAGQLAAANDRRREIEREILFEADAQAAMQRDRFAIVVAGEGWHPGVLGIIAGRIADRYNRPAVALSIEEGIAAGSGRAGGVFDLHGGLAACSELLNRFGGHRAAAGLELDADRLDRFREQFSARADRELTLDDLRRRMEVDAFASPADVNLDAVAALEAIGPFGAGNPPPRLLLAGPELVSVRKLGSGGQHYRLGVAQYGERAQAVAFRQERVISDAELPRPVDFVVELQRNEFNGREEAQAVVQAIVDMDPAPERWIDEFNHAVSAELPRPAGGELDVERTRDLRGVPIARVLTEVGPEAIVVVHDIARWEPTSRSLKSHGIEHRLLAFDDPALLEAACRHVVLVEPPVTPALAGFGDAEVTLAWNQAAVTWVCANAHDLLLSREHTVAAFRAVRGANGSIEAAFDRLRVELPSARVAGRAIKVLAEMAVLTLVSSEGRIQSIEVVEQARSELDRSESFRSYSDYRDESEPWLRQLTENPIPRS